MKRIFLNLFLATIFASSFSACKNDTKKENGATNELAERPENPLSFQLEPASSHISWTGSKPGAEHHGTIEFVSGEFHFDATNLESGQVKIDMSSITVLDEGMTADKKRSLENHLKGTAEGKENDFFNTKEFPTASFGITNIKNHEETTWIEGNLTMRKETHLVKFPVKITWARDNSSVKIVSEKFTIDRTKWGVNYGSKSIFGNLGNKFINDEIGLQIFIKAVLVNSDER